ncbi:MAG: hypothetical protein MUO91_08110 [candidate division Zixibacteria bacterium]|nr:hypothetical protein [candidate division Zixibacteria bacterium]
MWYALIKVIKFHRLNIAVILCYFLFTLIFTFPLFLHISTSTPLADRQGDQFQSMWMFWWFKTALLNLKTNPLYTNFVYYPHGSSLIYHMPIFLSLLALPFQYLFGSPAGLIIGYNLILMFTFVLSGFGVYLLTKYLVKDPVTAFICGLLFAFCPYRLWHLNHLNLLSTEWIPFYILYLIKSVDEKSLKNFLWTGAFFIFTFLSDFTCALFLVLFTLIYLIYLLVKSRKQLLDKKVIRNSSIALFTVIIILSPLLYSLSSTKIAWPQPSMDELGRYSANLLGYFLPVKERSLLGSHLLPSQRDYNAVAGGEIFLGYILLFSVLYTWIKLRGKKIKFWFFSSLVFLLLSLGHTLHIYNHSYYSKWLPYNLLYTHVPLLQIGRTPCRFSLMATLCLIIFSSYGLTRFFNLHNTKDKNLSDLKNFFRGFLVRKGMPLVVVMLACSEFIVLPTTLIKVDIPECYKKIKDTQGEFAILELPASFSGVGLIGNVYMFYQTVHEKKIVNGYLTRHSPNSMDFLKELFPEENITLDSRFRDKLAQSNVKQVIVHEYQKRLEGTLENEDTSCLVIKEKPSSIKVFQSF